MGLRQIAMQKAKVSNGLEVPFQFAGTPVNNSTFVGRASVGSLLQDTTTGKLYSATVATSSTVTWVLIGAQT
jgi:hypothetical protein